MTLTRSDLTGPWAGLPVAWTDDGRSFDEEAYRDNVARTCRAGVPGIYTAGTSGEFYAMEFDEWQRISRATVEECRRHGTGCMLGVTSTYTLGAQRRAACAAELGADAIQVALPFWMEVDDRHIVPFFQDVADAGEGLPLTVYETRRSKKSLSVEQHRAISDSTGRYWAVKANAGTVGRTPEGCQRLSEFVNVWVSETEWANLGPYGVIGCASALVYMNPRFVLRGFDLLRAGAWDELVTWCAVVRRHHEEGLAPFAAMGFTDTAYDHLHGLVAGFLRMSPVSRGPYPSCTQEHVEQLRAWMQTHTPELLQL